MIAVSPGLTWRHHGVSPKSKSRKPKPVIFLLSHEALPGEDLVPGIIVAVQTFGDRINFHPHLHLLLTEGKVGHRWDRDGAGLTTMPHQASGRLDKLPA
jgi:hypothetical protein